MTSFTVRKILTSQTVGERLAKIRAGHNLSLAEAARRLGIKKIYLEAIEAGLYHELPGNIYALEFVKSYARLLRLDATVLARAYTQERAERGRFPLTRARPSFFKRNYGRLLPKAGLAAVLALAVFGLGRGLGNLLEPPRLELFSPATYYEATDARLFLSGQTAPKARLFVNNQELAVDENGSFTEVFYLPAGPTLLKIAAQNKWGRKRVAYRTIVVPETGQLQPLSPFGEDLLGQVAGVSTTRETIITEERKN